MRNLSAHPLRDEEVQNWLACKLEEYQASGLIGGLDAVIISHLKSLVDANTIQTTTTKTTTARD